MGVRRLKRDKNNNTLGFKRCLVPKMGAKVSTKDIQLIPTSTLKEAIKVGLIGNK